MRIAMTLVVLSLVPRSGAAVQRVNLTIPIEDLEAAAVRDSNDAAVQYNLGLGLLVKKHYDQAEEAFRSAIAVNPKFAPAYLALSFVPYARRDKLWKEVSRGKVSAEWQPVIDEAYDLRFQAYMLDPFADLSVIGAVVPPRESLHLTKRQMAVYQRLVRGFEYLWGARYDNAFEWFDGLLRAYRQEDLEPPEWLLWYHGLAAGHTFRYTVAVSDFQRLMDWAAERDTADVLQQVPFAESNYFRYIIGVIYQQAGKRQQAFDTFRQVLEYDLSMYMAHVRIADLYESRKLWRKAMVERQRALEVKPDDSGLMLDLGLTYVRMGYWSDAEEILRQAMEINPRNPRIPYLYADACVKLDRPEAARGALTRFIALAPSNFHSQVVRARVMLDSLSAGN